MKINVLGAHNTESRDTRYMSLVVDDILALDAGSLTSGLTFQEQVRIKALFITHSHYDHIRDIPAYAINLYLREKSVDLYTHQAVFDDLTRFFLNDQIYPEFHKKPQANPTLRMHLIEPYQTVQIEGYRIVPAPVNHALPTMGYQITSPDNRTMFYTGDTGSGLSELWKKIEPQVLFIELTALNRWEEAMNKSKHLDSRLLQQELIQFREIKGYLPRVIAVHLNPADESGIKAEADAVSRALGITIELAHEGMQIEV